MRVEADEGLLMLTVAILYENDTPIRAWKGEACIYKAYQWVHWKFCLDDEDYKIHQLPDDLKIKLHLLTEEEFESLVKQ